MTSWSIGGEGGNSFPFDNIGDHVAGKVLDLSEVQQTDMSTNQPAFWDDGKPKMMYKVVLQTELRNPQDPSDDGKRSVFLRGSKKPESQSLLAAVLGAVKTATGGTDLAYGGHLTVQYIGDGVPSQRGFNAPKLYAAWYQAPPMTLEQPAEHRAPAPMPPVTQQQHAYVPPNQGPPPDWAVPPQAPPPPAQQQPISPAVQAANPMALPPQQPATLAGQPNPFAQPGASGPDPFPQQQPPPAQGVQGSWTNQPPQQQGPPPPQQVQQLTPTQIAGTVGQPITPEQIAGVRSLGQDPANVFGPDWQSRIQPA